MLLLAFIGGTLESGSTGVLPVFALELNFTTTIAAATVAFIGAGSLLGQFPLGYLSDRVGVKKVAITTLLVLSLFTPLLALSETYAPAFNQQALLTVGFLWGFAGGGLYTLAIISVGHSFSGDRLVRVMGLLVVLYTLGASVGPILKTALYTLGGLSYTILLVTALLVTITLLYLRFSRPSRRFIPPPPPTGDHTPYDRMGHAG
jgi:MFS family permease